MQIVVDQNISTNQSLAKELGKYVARYFMEAKHREEYYAWAKANGIEVSREEVGG